MECLKHWGPYPYQSTISMPPLWGYPWWNMSVYGQGTTCCRVKPARLSNKAPSLAIEIGDWDPTVVATCLLLCFYMFLVFAKKRLKVHQSDNLPLAKGWGGSTGVLVTWSWTTYQMMEKLSFSRRACCRVCQCVFPNVRLAAKEILKVPGTHCLYQGFTVVKGWEYSKVWGWNILH